VDRSRCWSTLFVGIPVRTRRASLRGTPSLTSRSFASSLSTHELVSVAIDGSATEAIRTGDTHVQHDRLEEKRVLAVKDDADESKETHHRLLRNEPPPNTTANRRTSNRSHSHRVPS
jgi:hypothetical protein